MERPRPRRATITTAVMVYVILLLGLQIFLLTVAVEGFLEDDPGLAWAATGVSVFLALLALVLFRYLRDD